MIIVIAYMFNVFLNILLCKMIYIITNNKIVNISWFVPIIPTVALFVILIERLIFKYTK
jgi:hypothetical protein